MSDKTVIVLAMHGMPPKDFPVEEKKEFMKLHVQLGHNSSGDSEIQNRHDSLDLKMRTWPRNEDNDPFFIAAQELSNSLEENTGHKVYLGFNEFCAPSVEQALEESAKDSPSKVIIATPMMTRGGNHSEEEIPESIEVVAKKYPNIQFEYAWPFSTESIAQFLAGQITNRN